MFRKIEKEGTAVMLLARRLKAADLDAKHPGKAEENPRRKLAFALGFSWLSWDRSPLYFVTPKKQARSVR